MIKPFLKFAFFLFILKMQGSKIRLSLAEAALFCNAETILTKNRILQKTASLLGEVQQEFVERAPAFINKQSPSPKISKGENYLGLPYVILDYPRISNGNDLLFIRSMFWWGNFYSSTLQLTGSFRHQFADRIRGSYEALHNRGYAVGINPDPWVHHFGPENYRSIQQLSSKAFEEVIAEQYHTKIAASWPLTEWDMAAIRLLESWKFLISLIS